MEERGGRAGKAADTECVIEQLTTVDNCSTDWQMFAWGVLDMDCNEEEEQGDSAVATEAHCFLPCKG